MRNRKGIVDFTTIFTVFVLVLVVIVLAAAQNNVDTSAINKTIDSLNWSNTFSNLSASIDRSFQSPDQPEYMHTIGGILNKAIDFMGYSIFAVAKLAMELARDNPDIINYKVLFALIIFSLIAPLIYPAFIITISLILIVREWWMNRKEQKKLDALRRK